MRDPDPFDEFLFFLVFSRADSKRPSNLIDLPAGDLVTRLIMMHEVRHNGDYWSNYLLAICMGHIYLGSGFLDFLFSFFFCFSSLLLASGKWIWGFTCFCTCVTGRLCTIFAEIPI